MFEELTSGCGNSSFASFNFHRNKPNLNGCQTILLYFKNDRLCTFFVFYQVTNMMCIDTACLPNNDKPWAGESSFHFGVNIVNLYFNKLTDAVIAAHSLLYQ